MKKMFALLLVLVLALTCLSACGASSDSDLKYIQKKGTMIVGITDYEPMDYKDENGNWTGFDAELAEQVCEKLGVKCEFLVLGDWGKKFYELETKNVDAIWNGMTITDEVKLNTNCSDAYVVNAQVLVMKADALANYTTPESLSDLTFAVENGSAGQEAVLGIGIPEDQIIAVQDQAAALMEVAAGTSDAAVIDSLMAAAMVGEGTGYSALTYTCGLNSEEYGVGFRKGSDLAQKLNDFFKASYDDGTMMQIAETYGVQAAIIEQ